MAYLASSVHDFKPGMRVRLNRQVLHYPAGLEGIVDKAGVFLDTTASVCFDCGHTIVAVIPTQLGKIGPAPWAIGTRVRAIVRLRDMKTGSYVVEPGDEGTATTLPQEITRIAVKFNEGAVNICEANALKSVSIIDPGETAPPGPTEVAVPAPAAATTTAAAASPERRHNRWGDGLDAPAAGARDFFPPGWTPSGDVYEAIKKFGHPDEAIAKIQAKGERLERELAGFDVRTVPEFAAAVYAYTEEDPVNDLYGKLNAACRTSGVMAEKRLAVYREYIYHLQEALTTLPSFPGRVYRGTDCRVDPESYAVGNKVTWQQFASASKSQQVARKFVAEYKGQLSGSYFICDVKNGKEIDMLSAFPAEEEVLLKPNTFFKVVEKLADEAAKKAALKKLAGYDLNQLEVYVLKQL